MARGDSFFKETVSPVAKISHLFRDSPVAEIFGVKVRSSSTIPRN